MTTETKQPIATGQDIASLRADLGLNPASFLTMVQDHARTNGGPEAGLAIGGWTVNDIHDLEATPDLNPAFGLFFSRLRESCAQR